MGFAISKLVVNEMQLMFPKAMHKLFEQCRMKERDKTMTLNVLYNNKSFLSEDRHLLINHTYSSSDVKDTID